MGFPSVSGARFPTPINIESCRKGSTLGHKTPYEKQLDSQTSNPKPLVKDKRYLLPHQIFGGGCLKQAIVNTQSGIEKVKHYARQVYSIYQSKRRQLL